MFLLFSLPLPHSFCSLFLFVYLCTTYSIQHRERPQLIFFLYLSLTLFVLFSFPFIYVQYTAHNIERVHNWFFPSHTHTHTHTLTIRENPCALLGFIATGREERSCHFTHALQIKLNGMLWSEMPTKLLGGKQPYSYRPVHTTLGWYY